MNYENIFSVIDKIYNRYDEILALWIENNDKASINVKKKDVIYFTKGNNIEYVYHYRNFLENNTLEFRDELSRINLRTRIKIDNSIDYKINKYATQEDKEGNIGKFPIKDCFNDLFGARIIVSDEYDLSEILTVLKENYEKPSRVVLKDDVYKAVHFYFKRTNQMLPWELQIWRECDEENNKKSHKIYKQTYTEWEVKIKGLSSSMIKMVEQIEAVSKVVTPSLIKAGEQIDSLSKTLNPSVIKGMEQMDKVSKIITPTMIRAMEQQRLIASKISPSMIKAIELNSNMEKYINPKSNRQNKKQDILENEENNNLERGE